MLTVKYSFSLFYRLASVSLPLLSDQFQTGVQVLIVSPYNKSSPLYLN